MTRADSLVKGHPSVSGCRPVSFRVAGPLLYCKRELGQSSEGEEARRGNLIPGESSFSHEDKQADGWCRATALENFIFKFIFGGEGVELALIHGNLPNSLALLPPQLPCQESLDGSREVAHTCNPSTLGGRDRWIT